MKIKILIFFVTVLATVSFYQTFTVDELDYELIDADANQVELKGGTITGGIEIPKEVTYDNVTYTVTSIGDSAFESATLTSVEISNSVISIGNYAFEGNEVLASVISKNTTPPTLGDDAFLDISNDAILYVPSGTTQSYIDEGWKVYFSAIEEDVFF